MKIRALEFKNEKQKKILIVLCLLSVVIMFLCYPFYVSLRNKPTGKENITTKITTESDFLNWFIDFDKLYNKTVKSPKYKLKKEIFEEVYVFHTNENNTNIYFKDNIYYIDNSTTLELDVNTSSFRYTDEDEILEVNLLNGMYYVQLINNHDIYRIKFNKNGVKKSKEKNKENKVIVNNSIYGTNNFDW